MATWLPGPHCGVTGVEHERPFASPDLDRKAIVAQPERICATRRIAATAGDIFKILTDPNGHVRIDGSGMVVAAPDAKPLERLTTLEQSLENLNRVFT